MLRDPPRPNPRTPTDAALGLSWRPANAKTGGASNRGARLAAARSEESLQSAPPPCRWLVACGSRWTRGHQNRSGLADGARNAPLTACPRPCPTRAL